MSAARKAVVERRKYIRLSAIARVEYSVIGEGGILGSSRTRDMSRDGVRITCTERLKKGTLLDLRIETGEGIPPISARVKTVWCKRLRKKGEYDVGALFTDIQAEDKDRLLDYAYRFWVERTRRAHRPKRG